MPRMSQGPQKGIGPTLLLTVLLLLLLLPLLLLMLLTALLLLLTRSPLSARIVTQLDSLDAHILWASLRESPLTRYSSMATISGGIAC